MTDQSPTTQRSRDECECSILRAQLRLADNLARSIAPYVNDLKLYRGRLLPKDKALIDDYDLYAQARILAETGKEPG